MMKGNVMYQISPNEVSCLHNAKCDLYQLEQFVSEHFKDDSAIAKRVKSLKGYLNPVANRLMDEKDKEWARIQRIYESDKSVNNFSSIFSIYENRDYPDDWIGKKMVYQGWGEKVSETIMSRLDNLSYLDMWETADSLIKKSGDSHHIFIEDFIEQSDGTIRLVTGS